LQAIQALASIPPRHRATVPTVQGALGALYRKLGQLQEAVAAYKACVTQHPLALEAVVGLAELGERGRGWWGVCVCEGGWRGRLTDVVVLESAERMNQRTNERTDGRTEPAQQGLRRRRSGGS
jgi:hypothetical protein